MNSKLWVRMLVPVSLCVLLVMGISLWYSIVSQNKFGQEQLTSQNKILAQAIEGGMFDALAIGDNDTVRNQFKQLNKKADNLKVYVYDFNGLVSFSTDINSVAKPVKDTISDLAYQDLSDMLKSGKASEGSIEMTIGDTDYIIKNDPIANEKRCYHCHGDKRAILGGISVLSSMNSMQQSIRQGRNTSILISTAGICVIILLVWMFFHFLVNKKVVQVVEATARMREKDFTHEYSAIQGDEIDHILNRINMVTQELRGTIKQIIDGSVTLGKSSQGMSQIADALDVSSTKASDKASSVSAAAEEMSTNNRAIATAMEDAAENVNALAAAVDEMSATVGEIAKSSSESKGIIDQVVESFDLILTAVEDLGVRADDVDVVTNEIRSISEQVSLLALNAKIEAARAGEAGKGFAVVAQEITDLASDTNKSTLDADEKLARIKTTVKDLIQKVSGLAGSVKDSDEAISTIAVSVEEQNATTLEISKSINEVNTKISDVNDSVTQGAKVASEIAQDITSVEEMFTKVQKESHNLNQGATDLARMAEKFTDLMTQFKV